MVELTCVQCGKLFLRTVGEVNRKRKAKTGPFCGKACRNTFHSKGKKWTKAQKTKLAGRIPWNKGKPWSKRMRNTLSIAASNGSHAMEKNGNWRGGRSIRPDGYVEIRVNGKPKMEHVHILEQHLGRKLDIPREICHHKNGIKTDNRLENLTVTTMSVHMKHHNPHGPKRRKRKAICRICKRIFYTLGTGDLSRAVCRRKSCKRQQARQYDQAAKARRRARIAANS